MTSILIRGLDDALKRQLRLRAAENARSMEEEVRQILRHALGGPTPEEKGPKTVEEVAESRPLRQPVPVPPPEEEGRPAPQEFAVSRPLRRGGRVKLFGSSRDRR